MEGTLEMVRGEHAQLLRRRREGQVKATGISFATFACLARCQGLDVDAVYGSESNVDEFRRVVKRACNDPAPAREDPDSWKPPTSFLVVSYHRGSVGQTGTGHFSPVGAYDEASDSLLVLDTARFKYGPHWIKLPMMFDALLPVVPGTGRSRGYVVLGKGGRDAEGDAGPTRLPVSVLFRSEKAGDPTRREYKRYLRELKERGEEVTLKATASFWKGDHEDGERVWRIVEPRLRPVETEDVEMAESVRGVVRGLMEADARASGVLAPTDASSSEGRRGPPGSRCSPNSGGRFLEIDPAEAVYIVYLASLPPNARGDAVSAAGRDGPEGRGPDDEAREQLLAEAELISYALEACDEGA